MIHHKNDIGGFTLLIALLTTILARVLIVYFDMKTIFVICFLIFAIPSSFLWDTGNTNVILAANSNDGLKEKTKPRILLQATDSTTTSENSGIPEHLSITYQIVGNKIANNETVELVFKANLTHHKTIMYSSDSLCAFGPMPATVDIIGEACEKIGPLVSLNTKAHSDEVFECDYKYFEDDIEMRQQVKLKDISKALQMTLAYQLCNDEEGFCLNLEHAIMVDLVKAQK